MKKCGGEKVEAGTEREAQVQVKEGQKKERVVMSWRQRVIINQRAGGGNATALIILIMMVPPPPPQTNSDVWAKRKVFFVFFDQSALGFEIFCFLDKTEMRMRSTTIHFSYLTSTSNFAQNVLTAVMLDRVHWER